MPEAECKECGKELEGSVDYYCSDCYDKLPTCDDCDEVIEDGDYHLCDGCYRKRKAQME